MTLALAGCATNHAQQVEKGPQGTIAYLVEIETSDPGARIEADNEAVGKAPLTLKIYGDKDGTFHNFGSGTYVIKAYPTKPGQFVQTKVFHTGGWFSQEDRIPKKLYFDLNLEATEPKQKIDGRINK